jgi:hypothetical protein
VTAAAEAAATSMPATATTGEHRWRLNQDTVAASASSAITDFRMSLPPLDDVASKGFTIGIFFDRRALAVK